MTESLTSAYPARVGDPVAPGYLRPSSRAWWERTASAYHLEDHHLHLLTLAATALDRAEEARVVIEVSGAVYVDRFGQPKAHPAVGIERDARIGFARLVHQLDLDTGQGADVLGEH